MTIKFVTCFITSLSKELLNNILVFETLFILLIIISVTVYFFKQKTKRELEKKLIDKQLAEYELKVIQSQMNPHFIFNSLNTIKHYVYINNKDMADFAIDCFSIFLRKYLEFSALNFITIEQEVKLLETYLALENLRSNDLFDSAIEVGKGLDKIIIPNLLIQPFVENAIKHGIINANKKCLIQVKFEKEESFLICSISDNGIGREKSKAIDMINTKIKLIKKITGLDIAIEINDFASNNPALPGTIVTLKIPLLHDKDSNN